MLNLLTSSIIITGMFTNLMYQNNTVEETEQASNIQISENLDGKENDDLFRYLEVKALEINNDGFIFYMLHDGQGEMFLSFENVFENNQNYVIEVGKYSEKVYAIDEINRNIQFENLFDDYLEEDTEIAYELFYETVEFM